MKQKIITRSINGLRFRSSPHDGETLAILPQGTKLEKISESLWLKVKMENGAVGYVHGDYVENDETPPDSNPAEEAQEQIQEQADRYKLVTYSSPKGKVTGDKAIRVDVDFLPVMEVLEEVAVAISQERNLDFKLSIVSSFRDPDRKVDGAIVNPARRSNHHVGHAVDFNCVIDGKFINSGYFKRKQEPEVVREFISRVKKSHSRIRWGGDFSTPDYVHFDDGLNVYEQALFQKKLLYHWA